MNRLNPKSLRSRIALAAAIFAAVICLLGLLTYAIVHEEIERHLDDRIKAEANALLAASGNVGLTGLVAAVRAREARHNPGDLGYIVLDAANRRIAGSLDARAPAPGYTEFVHYRRVDGRRGVAQAFNVAVPGGGRLVVVADRRDVEDMDSIIFWMFAAALGMIAFAGLILALLLQRSVERRLASISESAEAIIAGDLSQRIPSVGDAEFDRIGAVINAMLGRVEALMGNLRQVSTDLAHDIRSPLNRVRGRIELLVDADEKTATLATAAGSEIDGLLELLEGIMSLSEIESQAARKRFARVDLAGLVADVVEGFRPAIDTANMTVNLELQDVFVRGDAILLRRCIANLLDNILIHANGATKINVRIWQEGEHVTMEISDDGPGVPNDTLRSIFQRFVRLDVSRSSPGHGLGLNIVEAVARAHGGTTQARNGERGLIVELSFPAAV